MSGVSAWSPVKPGVVTRLPLSRLASALVLAPPALLAVWVGSPAFDLLIALGALLLAREWWRMSTSATHPAHGVALGLALILAVALAAIGEAGPALLVLAAAAAGFIALGGRWLAFGTLYLGLPCVSMIWLRADPVWGRETLLWLFAVVWASDIGAFAVGRWLGGWKLAPRVSPNKTWSGAIGGLAAAALVGSVIAIAFAHEHPLRAAAMALVISLIAQGGDLVESGFKRHFGVKDTGRLIPGHGGLLDRVDALLMAAMAMGLLTVIREGSILAWI